MSKSGRGQGSRPAARAAVLARLVQAAKTFEADVVIPHCAQCSRPCCGLTDVVLDLGQREALALYQIQKGRPLPAALRRQGPRYYAHGAPCPAFDTSSHRCGVYDTDVKPQGCSDFPIYADDDVITIDLRCEAIAAAQQRFEDALVSTLNDDETLAISVDVDHPDTFVSFGVEFEGHDG